MTGLEREGDSLVEQASEDTIHHSIVVDASAEHAFHVFTARFNEWWPAVYTFAGADLDVIGIECRTGGRCYERDRDGHELIWGEVTVCDEPKRLVFAWWISPNRTIEIDTSRASEIEVRFSAEPAGTRVDLEHRGMSRHSGDWRMMQAAMASQEGWPMLLQAYADVASREA